MMMMRTMTKTTVLLLCLLATVPSSHAFQPQTRVSCSSSLSFFLERSTSRAIGSNTQLNFFSVKKEPETTTSAITSSSASDDDNVPSFAVNPIYGAAWLALAGFAVSNVAPGSLGAPEDAQLFQAILENPTHPQGVNELFYFVFNLFAVIPVLLANIFIPQARENKGLPAWPFLVASSAIGYFSAGVYFSLRAPPKETYDANTEDVSWFVKNVLENKAVSWFLVAFTLYLPFGAHVFEVDPQTLWQGFVDIETSSRVAAVSTIDLALMYLSAVAGTGRDYRLRVPDASDEQVNKIVAATALVPLLGTAVYCALRPPLPPLAEE